MSDGDAARARLAACVAVAALLHALAMSLLPVPPAASTLRPPLAAVLLRQRTPPAPPPAEPAAPRRSHAAVPEHAQETSPSAAAALNAGPAPPDQPRQTTPSTAVMVERARRIARSETGRSSSASTPDTPRLTPEAIIERGLRRPAPGEQRIGRDLLKVTTAGGTSYCLKTSNEGLRGGVVEPLSVPTNCP